MIHSMLIGTAVTFGLLGLYVLGWIINNPWLLGN